MAKRGPKPKYDPIFAGHARRLCMLGATMQELADYFGVARCTIAVRSPGKPRSMASTSFAPVSKSAA